MWQQINTPQLNITINHSDTWDPRLPPPLVHDDDSWDYQRILSLMVLLFGPAFLSCVVVFEYTMRYNKENEECTVSCFRLQ